MMGRILVTWTLVVLTGCDTNSITFSAASFSTPSCTTGLDAMADGCTPSCMTDFDATPDCPPSACPWVGAWQNVGLADAVPACAEGAISFDDTGAVSHLTSAGWMAAGRYATCSNRARSPEFSDLFSVHLPAGCGPPCDATIVTEAAPNGGRACVVHVDMPCHPVGAGIPSALSVTLLYNACTP
jgi:hypothetical protein